MTYDDVQVQYFCGGGGNDAFANMASWKCGAYFVVAIIVVVLIILLNFDYLPKRKLSEELELTTKSGLKVSVVPTDGSVTKTISRASSVVEKVRPLKFHGFYVNIPNVSLLRFEVCFKHLLLSNFHSI